MSVALALVGCGQTTDSSESHVSAESAEDGAAHPQTCSELGDDASSGSTVRIVNGTSDTIYLGQEAATCVTEPLFSVHDSAGQQRGEPGAETCTDVLAGSSGGVPLICLSPRAVALLAGEAADVPWIGLFSQFTRLPLGCAGNAAIVNGAPSCWRSLRPEPGTYVFSATAGRAASCVATSGGCEPCKPRPGGGCEIVEATVSPLELAATAEVTLTSNAASGQPGTIELLFTD